MEETPNTNALVKLETRNIFRTSNICIFIYLLLNVVLIWSILSRFQFDIASLGTSLLVYAVSLLIALSPIGEFILRLQTGCKKIKREDHKQLIEPLFNEVYGKAKAIMPEIPDGIKLYMSADNAPNAFATGRRTICVTRGLLKMPPEQIKAILGHEFGHIAHRDTYLLQAVIVGNFIVTFLVVVLRIVAIIATLFAEALTVTESSFLGRACRAVFLLLAHLAIFVGFTVFMWLWTKIGILLCMKSSRENEYEADRFSSNCGYNKELIDAFETLAESSEAPKGIFATLASSHPDFDDRIAKLQGYQKEAVA